MLQPIVRPAQLVPPMRSFTEDFAWQEKFIPDMAAIIGQVLLQPAPLHIDRNQNKDLILRCIGDPAISCRMRRFSNLAKYPDDITLRAARPSGASTELDKLDTCATTHQFYGFANERDDGIAAWTLLDLKRLREWFRTFTQCVGHEPGERRQNPDGTEFIILDLNILPSGLIVDRQRSGDAA